MSKLFIPSQLVFIGFGMVSKALMTLMLNKTSKYIHLPILIIEPKEIDTSIIIQKLAHINPKIKHFQQTLTKHNYKLVFNKYITENALIIDLSWRVKTSSIIQECQNKQCLYINTAIDDWNHTDMTLYNLKKSIFNEVVYNKNKMTSVINHGMNPGMVSHITKTFLKNMSKKSKLKIDDNKYNEMAKELGLTLIQIAERDTQITKLVTTEQTFYNTWSVIGLIDEALLKTEISFGTHEKKLPYKADKSQIKETGQIILPIPCHQVRAKTFEPIGGLATGYCIAHAECYSLAQLLMLPDYRVSVYYTYLVPDVAKSVCHYLEYSLDKNFLPKNEHVLCSDEIISGYDSVGCLFYLRNPNLKIYWFGSVMQNNDIKKISPEINGTCMQVAVNILACLDWMIENPNRGMIEPEEVDSDYIIQKCKNDMGYFKCLDVTKQCNDAGINSDQLSDLLISPSNILF